MQGLGNSLARYCIVDLWEINPNPFATATSMEIVQILSHLHSSRIDEETDSRLWAYMY
jgi:hypothetical protein